MPTLLLPTRDRTNKSWIFCLKNKTGKKAENKNCFMRSDIGLCDFKLRGFI